ncbi:MAG: hypothetical protein HUU41_22905 [Bryobacteraceae bacterium]|nr:hypothetical protein [Bryobacteraceae bacterium]
MSRLDASPAAEPMPVVHYDATGEPIPPWPSPVTLRKLPRQVQERILAASAALAEEEYRTNKDLTDFEAFAEEP